jgi:hypothetical protein
LIRTSPDAPFASAELAVLNANLTPAHIAGEVAYLNGAGRESFKRPDGVAWLLRLAVELRETPTRDAAARSATLKPLTAAVVARLKRWIPKRADPIREGEHAQTAFAFGVIRDYARTQDPALSTVFVAKLREVHLHDRDCSISQEPSGQDLVSPCLAEADVMRRILPPSEFAAWLKALLPRIPTTQSGTWLPIGVVTDNTDGKLAPLDGRADSRAERARRRHRRAPRRWTLARQLRDLPHHPSRHGEVVSRSRRRHGNRHGPAKRPPFHHQFAVTCINRRDRNRELLNG